MKTRFTHFLFCLIFSVTLHAQDRVIDSLNRILLTAKTDTNKVNVLNALCGEYRSKNKMEESVKAAKDALALAELIKWDKGVARSQNSLGMCFYSKSDYSRALDLFIKALEIEVKLGDKYSVAKHQNNIGVIYKNKGDYSKALDFYFKALKTGEEMKDKNLMATSLGNLGNLYNEQKDTKKAIDYYSRALKLSEEMGDKNASARHLANMGLAFKNDNELSLALTCLTRALSIAEASGYTQLQANTLGGIGLIYVIKGDSLRKEGKDANENYKKAQEYFDRSIAISERTGNKLDMAIQLNNSAGIYSKQKKYPIAIDHLFRSLALARELHALKLQHDICKFLSDIYSESGNYPLAFDYYKKFVVLRDSLSNEDATKKQTQVEMQYEFDKQQTADSIKNAEQVKQEEIKNTQEVQQQKIYTYGGLTAFLLMLVVAGVSFRAYRQKQKANAIITEQKILVEIKQKEVLDSIHYAKRIQLSLLPTERYIERSLTRLYKN